MSIEVESLCRMNLHESQSEPVGMTLFATAAPNKEEGHVALTASALDPGSVFPETAYIARLLTVPASTR